MTWARLVEIIAEEVGSDVALRIESRILVELRGLRVTVGARGPLTAADVDAVAPGRPQQAARILGVHQSTVYRALRRADAVR